MLYTKLLIIFLLNLLAWGNSASAQTDQAGQAPGAAGSPPVSAYSPEAPHPIDVGSAMWFAEDPEHLLNIERVLNNPPTWQEIERRSPNFGFTATAYWFTFVIDNTSPDTESVYIELPIPFLDNVSLFHVSEKEILQSHRVGDRFPFDQRPVRHQNLVMPFELAPGANVMIMRVSSAGTVEAPLFIWNPEKFASATADDRLLQGIWIGVLAIMVIYNLFLYALLKDISYLYYVAFAFSYLMFQITLKGYGFAYLWPELLHWNSYAISTFIALCNFFAAMMIISFLELKQKAHVTYRLMSVIALFGAIMFVLTFVLPYQQTIRITSIMTVLTCILSLSSGYWSWYKGNTHAKYFCLAWTSAFGGVGFLAAAKFGVLPANYWTNNAGQIGILMLVALLSFALANRFNREKEMRLYAQEASLESEKLARKSQDELLRARLDVNKKLERKVTERTETLERAMLELEEMNRQLEIMSTTDALTQVHNRGHFENCLQLEFKRAIRHKRPLSIILCDIDHFKRINDSYGHKAGDECLRAIADVFRNRVSRPGDLLARYGGEEFIALLADTNLDQARAIAMTLLEGVRRLNFQFASKSISVTASFGVSTLNTVGVVSADQLVTQADLSLYQAKDYGRNQVVCWDAELNGPELRT